MFASASDVLRVVLALSTAVSAAGAASCAITRRCTNCKFIGEEREVGSDLTLSQCRARCQEEDWCKGFASGVKTKTADRRGYCYEYGHGSTTE